ncbi:MULTISPECIES: type II secretion system F family protein [unclassified Crossiella]|uniref:type II secretion system F family protein n=1 Tax=unclassified Crossiella TaxID=2620835 RepID=UPI001FFE2D5E|nr:MULTISPECIES: secretion system protein [unclassified Crossiella]MCK2237672.1 secretion system protein [Crossiella sp. S99.2]MCK2254958.1 secretion system protein [Crossiella sp. S99.1]
MTAAAAFALALALVLWPPKTGQHRLSQLRPPPPRQRRTHPTRVLLLIPPIGATLLAGIGGLLAATALTWTLHRQRTRANAIRTARHTDIARADALNLLVTQLRTGTHPALAAEAVAKEADPAIAPTVTALATAIRLGSHPDNTGNRLLRAWHTAHNHGIPLADLLDAERRDLAERTRFATQVEARLAGARATATILAALPVLPILLGEAMNAHPLRILTATPAGQFLLPLGALLICLGLEWSAHLTANTTNPKTQTNRQIPSLPPRTPPCPPKPQPPSS